MAPLNPPSFSGQDVFYSPDVYVNQSPVALWQPPQPRGIPPGATLPYVTAIEGEGLQFQSDSAIASNQMMAYAQQMAGAGLITQQDIAAAKGVNPSSGQASSGLPDNAPGIISNDTGGVENLPAFPSSLQLSRNFTLGQLTEKPYLLCDNHWSQLEKLGKTGYRGLTPGQLVANAKLLAVNALDLIKEKFPDMAVNSTIRPDQGNSRSQHMKFQACDFRLTRGSPYSYNYACALWIKDNVPFDQLLLEYNSIGSWIHVSYANPMTIPASSKLGTINTVTGAATFGKLVNLDAQFRIQTATFNI